MAMTTLLAKAFKTASALPNTLHDELAREVLREIEWERKWEASLKAPSHKLGLLAERARAEYRAGKTSEAGFGDL